MELRDLFPAAVTFVALGVLITFGLNVQTTVRNGFTTNTFEYNASTSAIQANANLSSNLPILGTIVIAAVVVGVLVRSFSLQ